MFNALRHSPLVPKQPIEWLLAILFIVSPFYIASSLGGTGLDLPFNITVWLAATWVISYSIWFFACQPIIVLPRNYLALLALPAGILISAAFAGVHDPMEWFFRVTYVLAGVLFLFGLFQFRIKNTDRILLLLAVATLLHGLYGLAQLFRPEFIEHLIPRTSTQVATGVFQQVNVMASFLVTGLLTSLYLLLRPITTRRVYLQSFLILTITIATYVVVATGSRVGLLSAILGLLLLSISYFTQVKKRAVRIIIPLVFMTISGWLAQDGLHKTFDKSYQLVEANYADARLIIYAVSLDVIADAPFFGHGIGSFLESWGRASTTFYQQNPVKNMPQYIAHPHNELLQWAIEGGVIAVAGILIALVSVLWFAFQLKKRRAFAYLALLLPISFHTLVEHPFYISSLHWFVWLLLLFALLSPKQITFSNSVSSMGLKTIKVVSIISLVFGGVLLLHASIAQKQLHAYVKQQQVQPMLNHAVGNPYFKRQTEQIILRSHLYNAIESNDVERVREILRWISMEIDTKPELRLFGDMLDGYKAIEDHHHLCLTANKGLSHYPANKAMLEIKRDSCDQN